MKPYDLTRTNSEGEVFNFRYFFDADVDDTGHIDIEGTDAYDIEDNWIRSIDFVLPVEIEELNDEEFDDFVDKHIKLIEF